MNHDSIRAGLPNGGPSRSSRVLTALVTTGAVVVVATTAAGCAGGGEVGGSVPPAEPPSAPQPERRPDEAPASTRPNEVVVERAVDLRHVPWTRADTSRESPRVRVFATFPGGPPCAVLGRVDTRETESSVTVTLWVGRRPSARCHGPQPAVGFPVVVTVDLRTPLADRALRDGADPSVHREPSG